MSKTQPSRDEFNTDQIEASNGRLYPKRVYTEAAQAVGTQQWVANQWADGMLPVHNCDGKSAVLRSKTGKLKGYQYPEGHGKLVHYAHIEAIRTHSGLVIGDKECYAKGRAKCSKPSGGRTDHTLPLTTLEGVIKTESIFDIVKVEDDPDGNGSIVEYGSGAVVRTQEVG